MIFYEEIPWIVEHFQPMVCADECLKWTLNLTEIHLFISDVQNICDIYIFTIANSGHVLINDRNTHHDYFSCHIEECPFEILELIQNLEHSKPLEG